MLDLTRLRVLAAVGRCGSVTAAAKELCYAQPSVSHHLARLESETGARLVQRVGRGIRLTEAGRVLAERAEEILGRLDAAEAELAAHVGLRAGRVRLAAFPSALGTFVPVAAASFATVHPDVQLRFVETEPPEALRLLRAGEVDVALVFDYPGAVAEDGLRRIPLFVEPVYLVTPRQRRRARTAKLVDYAGDRWIGGCERCRAHLVNQCAVAGFVPDIAFTTDDYVAAQALVAAGLGVATLPASALRAHRNPEVTAVKLPGGERTVLAAVYGEPPDPAGTAALLQHLDAAAEAVSWKASMSAAGPDGGCGTRAAAR